MEDVYHPGLENVIACETQVSYLDTDHEEIVIRGYDLIALAKQKSYLEIAHLVVYGQLPNPPELEVFAKQIQQAKEIPTAILDILRALPKTTHLMDYLRTGISALAGFDPDLDDRSKEASLRKTIRLLAYMPQLVAASHAIKEGQEPFPSRPELSYSAQFLYRLTGAVPTHQEALIFDQALSAYIEHEMPNSTFTARVIASTLSDLYGSLTGAVASLKGTLHGGANEAVMLMMLEAQQADHVESYLLGKLANKERIMGFGHRVYMNKMDPRALLMKEALAQLVNVKGQEELYARFEIGEKVMKREKNLHPNLDYYAAPVFYLLGIPIELYTPIFFAARTAGLCAHVLEQHDHNRLFRPRVRYTGTRGLQVTQVNEER